MTVEILLKSNTENISYKDFINLKQEYFQLLKEFPLHLSKINNTTDSIIFLKRKISETPKTIGIYKNITVFEAANRIATDLVIINGILQLLNSELKDIKQKTKFSIRLGNKHIDGKGDFTIGDKEGEAFNVANSFFRTKYYKTTSKWEKSESNLSYIFVNQEAIPKGFTQRRKKHSSIELVGVENWKNLD